MPKRKYRTEFALESTFIWGAVFQENYASDLASALGADASAFHIYVIGRRPRVGLKPNSLSLSAQTFKGILTVQHGSRFEETAFEVPNKTGVTDADGITVDCPFPHSMLTVRDRTGQIVARGPVAVLAPMWDSNLLEKTSRMEVLYVGQAYGDGSRSALDRLASHSTLQKINGECLNQSPDQEIWLFVLQFNVLLLSSIDGRTKDVEIDDDKDDKHINDVVSGGVSDAQCVNFTEAALIRYFEPQFNKMFKDNFPDAKHATYSDCYDLDINLVAVSMDTAEYGIQLWSPKIAAASLHLAHFPLHSREDRLHFFAIDGKDPFV